MDKMVKTQMRKNKGQRGNDLVSNEINEEFSIRGERFGSGKRDLGEEVFNGGRSKLSG